MSSIAHVGMTVTDVESAVAWYSDVLGLEPLGPVVSVRAGSGYEGALAAEVFGARFGEFRQAHLAGANGTALELFQFLSPPSKRRTENFAFRDAGLFHVCLVARDIEGTAARIAATGGRRRMARAAAIFPGEPYLTCYCEDPFGNVIELYSHSHERTYANRNGAG
jgi:catechol 2,3-dioxygenase-like lactoylglutathione lyase family enzyme